MPRGVKLTKNGDGSQTLEVGSVISILVCAGILAGGGALVTLGILGWRATASEAKVAVIEADVARQGRNQMRLDDRQRTIRKDVRWANKKLDAVLKEIGSTARVDEPDLPRTSLEPPVPGVAAK